MTRAVSRYRNRPRLFPAAGHRALVIAAAVAWPVRSPALTPETGPVGAAVAATGDLASPGLVLTLALVGVWLGLFGQGSRRWTHATIGAGLAGAIAGGVAGSLYAAPPDLHALITGAGGVVALMILANLRMPAVAPVAVAIIATLFGLGIGATFRLGGTALQFAAYGMVFVAGCALCGAVGLVVGKWLRNRGNARVVRATGGWMAALAALLVVNTALRGSVSLEASPGDLSVRSHELSEDEVPVLVQALLKQVYIAFEKTDEVVIYESLAAVVEGDVLADLYLQKRAALVLEGSGGARSELHAVELERVTAERLQGQPGYRVQGAWRVTGSVGHWGHGHDRVNRYEADLAILPVNGVWKIARFDLRDVVRDVPVVAR